MVYFLRGQPSIAFEPDEALATAPRAQFTLLFLPPAAARFVLDSPTIQ
jgi:hypothetical protein